MVRFACVSHQVLRQSLECIVVQVGALAPVVRNRESRSMGALGKYTNWIGMKALRLKTYSIYGEKYKTERLEENVIMCGETVGC